MKKLFFILVLTAFSLTMFAETVYDLQYTEDPSGNSAYMDQVVTVTGIVTAVNWYSGGTDSHFFISDPEGGEWSGIFVYNYDYTVALGDEVEIEATVQEYYGMTELSSLTALTVLSSGNTLPDPLVVTTGDLAVTEAYEGVLVQVNNVTATQEPNNYGEAFVDDGSGECQTDDAMFDFEPLVGDEYGFIRGMVDYSYDEYGLNPRTAEDIDFGGVPAFILGNVTLDGGTGNLLEAVVSIEGFSTNPSASGDYVLEVPAGTWDVTASLTGYTPSTVPAVTVEEGGTAIDVNFTLVPLPEATIYDIQYTEDPSGDSPFIDQEVTLTGIVTGAGYNNNNYFFMSTPEGGAWNGIYVYQFDFEVAEGDEVTVTGTISEYFGLTELGSVSSLTINSSGNAVPAPVEITTAELASSEAYESVLCKISDVTVTAEANENGEVYVSDGSGDCQVDDGFVSNPALVLGAEFLSITGVVDYSWDEYGLHPRSLEDFETETQPEEVPIYDIQFTEDPSGDSPYIDQQVIVSGIVTGAGFGGDSFFLSTAEGGAWNGIYVFQYDYTVEEGDHVTVAGTVQEYYGFTELGNVTSLTINSSGNTLPEPVLLTTNELATSEAYEGVLVMIENAEVTAETNEYGEAYVTDGTGECQIDDGFFTYTVSVGDTFETITGLVDYSFEQYGLHPRDEEDINIVVQPEDVTIYEIQYTEDPEGDSPYADQLITTEGVVVSANYKGYADNIFIAMPEGGAWKGLYCYAVGDTNLVAGDMIEITGVVAEYYGFTELTQIENVTVLSQGNAVPEPVVITTAALAASEEYESVLVQVEEVVVTVEPNEYGEGYINDGSGDCQLDDAFVSNPDVVLDAEFVSITGLVDYSFNEYAINARCLDDFVAGPQYMYGDVTGDWVVDSFDAANILQFAVGMEPVAVPLPWTWQFIAGDVDGNDQVEAYDAALILQYSVGMLDEFPVETRAIAPVSDFALSYENGTLVFTADQNLYSAAITISSSDVEFGNAKVDGEILSAINNETNEYAVASAEPIDGAFLNIPCNNSGSITITASINGYSSKNTYRIEDLTSGDITEVNAVLGNYPNPFNPVTDIMLSVASNNTPVKVEIYNVKGQLVETLYNGTLNKGAHSLTWTADTNQSASGIFFYKAQVGETISTGKMTMLK